MKRRIPLLTIFNRQKIAFICLFSCFVLLAHGQIGVIEDPVSPPTALYYETITINKITLSEGGVDKFVKSEGTNDKIVITPVIGCEFISKGTTLATSTGTNISIISSNLVGGKLEIVINTSDITVEDKIEISDLKMAPIGNVHYDGKLKIEYFDISSSTTTPLYAASESAETYINENRGIKFTIDPVSNTDLYIGQTLTISKIEIIETDKRDFGALTSPQQKNISIKAFDGYFFSRTNLPTLQTSSGGDITNSSMSISADSTTLNIEYNCTGASNVDVITVTNLELTPIVFESYTYQGGLIVNIDTLTGSGADLAIENFELGSFEMKNTIKVTVEENYSTTGNIIGYGKTKNIKITIEELNNAAFQKGGGTLPQIFHIIKLTPVPGYKFIHNSQPTGVLIKTKDINSSSDISGSVDATKFTTTLAANGSSITVVFETETDVETDKIEIYDVKLAPIPNEEATGYSGGVGVQIGEVDGSSIKNIKVDATDSYFEMVQPKLTIDYPDAVCQGSPFSLEANVTGTNSTIITTDELVLTYQESSVTPGLNPVEVIVTGDTSNTFVLDTLDRTKTHMEVTMDFAPGSSDWKLTETIRLGTSYFDPSLHVVFESVAKIVFTESMPVGVSAYKSRILLNDLIEPIANLDSLSITPSDPSSPTAMIRYYSDTKEYYFYPGVAGEGEHELVVKAFLNDYRNCYPEEILTLNVFPKLITMSPIFCYDQTYSSGGLEYDTISIALSAMKEVHTPDTSYDLDTMEFYSLKVEALGETIRNYELSDADEENKDFIKFAFNTSFLYDSLLGLNSTENLILTTTLEGRLRIYDAKKFYVTSNTGNPEGSWPGYSCTGIDTSGSWINYECKRTIDITKIISLETNESYVAKPQNNGILAGFDTAYCQYNDSIRLVPSNPVDTSIYKAGIFGNGITFDTTSSDYYFHPEQFRSDTNIITQITYPYYDENFCPGLSTYDVYVYAIPEVQIKADSSCVTDFQNFEQYTPDTNRAKIIRWNWDFGDGIRINNNSKALEDTLISKVFNTTGSYRAPAHKYTESGGQTIILAVESEKGCTASDTFSLTIGKVPKAGFYPTGYLENRPITFYNLTDSVGYDPVDTFRYIIQSPLGNIYQDTVNSYSALNFTPLESGVYSVTMEATTRNNCVDTFSTLIPVFPILEINNTTAYSDGFSETSLPSGWLHSKSFLPEQVSGWESAPVDSGFVDSLHTSGYIWRAGNPKKELTDEYGWLESPCYDIKDLDFPLLSIDIFQSIRAGQNGAVIQYSTDDGINWHILGNVDQGINWYNTKGIISDPGEQKGANIGWSNQLEEWQTARYPLDAIRDSVRNSATGCARFRVLYAASGATLESDTLKGFGVSNFYFGKRKRAVLIEQFLEDYSEERYIKEEAWLDEFARQNPKEVFPIKYHIGEIHVEPELFMLNWWDRSARATEYLIFLAEDKATVLDGLYNIPIPSEDKIKEAYYSRVLSDADFEIDQVTMEPENGGVRISARITQLSNRIQAEFGEEPQQWVRMAITQNEYTTANGETYNNVLMDLLPNEVGNVVVALPADMEAGEEFMVSDVWHPTHPVEGNGYRACIYIQTQFSHDEVHQVWFDSIPQSIMDHVSSVQGTVAGIQGDGLKIYPNPVSEKLTIELESPLSTRVAWALTDMPGRTILKGELVAGENNYSLNLASIPAGVYMLQMVDKAGNLTTRKITKQ